MDYFPVEASQTTITELMIPAYANFGGKVHGGVILSLMDKVAYACATKHARHYCVTASVDTVDFRSPVEVGELVSLHASVNYVGNSSLEIGIRTEALNIRSGRIKHTNTSYFTMVAVGEDGKPTPVPGLLLQRHEDIRRFLEAMRRRGLARRYRQDQQNLKTALEIAQEIPLLQSEKCRIALTDHPS
ncbi:MAG: acyl-CoA thioesterase [Bacteroidetes bacterium]|nr:MAG: acyl-CoA thioesterase [Bacteroidota bacterium]